MKSKIIICILVLIFFISAVSSTNLQDIGFNVSSELKQHDGDGLQFEDGTGDSFIIVEKQLERLDSEYKKYNETTYIFNESFGGDSINDAKGNEMGKMPVKHSFSCGEYVKINGKTYKVYISSYSDNPNYNKCLKYLNYFNEHNKLELVKIFD